MGEGATQAFHSPVLWARVLVASVWGIFGLLFKVLRFVPRHEQIVARIVGATFAVPITRLIGIGEILLGVWVISGWLRGWCAFVQTVLIVIMNSLEIRRARDLLLAPLPMVLGNTFLLGLAWYAARMP